MSRISMIVPFYHGNQYISRIVEMAWQNDLFLKKHGHELELIVVNDSPGCPVELVETPETLSLQVINQQENGGIHQARVTGIQHSSGDFILMLDQDDEIRNDFAIRQLNRIGTADVIVSNALIESADGEQKPLYANRHAFDKAFNVDAYIMSHNQIASPGQCLIRKSAIPREWMECIMTKNGSDDLFLWILMFCKNAEFVRNEDKIYIHKFTGKNLSASVQRMSESSLSMVEYLQQIEYVPAKLVGRFAHVRGFDAKFDRCRSPMGKAVLYLCNPDIFLSRVFWKIKCIF